MWYIVDGIFMSISKLIYGIIPKLYNLIIELAKFDLFKEGDGLGIRNGIWNNLYSILSVLVLFAIAVKLVNAIVNPDVLSDKKKGVRSVYFRSVVAVFLIVLLPILFDMLADFQDNLIDNSFIQKLLVTNVEQSGDGGQMLANQTASAFIEFNEEIRSNPFNTGNDVDAAFETLNEIDAHKYRDNGETSGVTSFNPLLMLASGIYIVYQLFLLVLDSAVRTIKLRILELMVPAVIGGYIFKPEILKTWFKEYIKTFLQLFLLIIAVTLISILLGLLSGVANNETTTLIFKALIIFGILTLAKQISPLINTIFGTNIKSKGGIKGRLGEMGAIGGLAQQAWGALGNRAKGITGAALGMGLGAAGVGAKKFGDFMTKKRTAPEGLRKFNQDRKQNGLGRALANDFRRTKADFGKGRDAVKGAKDKVINAMPAIKDGFKNRKMEFTRKALKATGNAAISGFNAAIAVTPKLVKGGLGVAGTLISGAKAGGIAGGIKAGKESAANQVNSLKASEVINKRKAHNIDTAMGQDNGKRTDASKLQAYNGEKTTADSIKDGVAQSEHIKDEGIKRLESYLENRHKENLLTKADTLAEQGSSAIAGMASSLKYSSSNEEREIGQKLEAISNKYRTGNNGSLADMLSSVQSAFIGDNGEAIMDSKRMEKLGINDIMKNISTFQDGINDIDIDLTNSFGSGLAKTRASLGTSISVASGNTKVADEELNDYNKLSSTTDVEKEEIEMIKSRGVKQAAQVPTYSEMKRYEDAGNNIEGYFEAKKEANENGTDVVGSGEKYYMPQSTQQAPQQAPQPSGGSGQPAPAPQPSGVPTPEQASASENGADANGGYNPGMYNGGSVTADVDFSAVTDRLDSINQSIGQGAEKITGAVNTQGIAQSQEISKVAENLKTMSSTMDTMKRQNDIIGKGIGNMTEANSDMAKKLDELNKDSETDGNTDKQ